MWCPQRCIANGATFKFWIKGKGSSGFKRDPYARELSFQGQPDENCIARNPASYAWHDSNFQSPRFNDLIVYQFHIGAFYSVDAAVADNRPTTIAKFLDVLKKLEYFAEQPLLHRSGLGRGPGLCILEERSKALRDFCGLEHGLPSS